MPDDGILVSGGGITELRADEVRGDWAHECSATDDDGGTTGLADLLPEGPLGGPPFCLLLLPLDRR
jgi:hypothetical protein